MHPPPVFSLLHGGRAVRTVRLAVLGTATLLATACGMLPPPEPIVQGPTSARPPMPVMAQRQNGAIYQEVASGSGGFRGMFEDRRAHMVGDTITIVITENTAASKQTSGTVDRSGSKTTSVPTFAGMNPGVLSLLGVSASDANKFDSKGANGAQNNFTATITVTVVEVLSNGNLVVSGEKQMAVGQGTESIKFSGVVNPTTVNNQNTVLSTQVADARMEYRGTGYVAEAQQMGWLSRFFLTVSPF
ncbi:MULTISPECIES: flagellar basal body L-ring protein FlgH [Ralstonia solanacearum species complex]|uniref:Flagellar L-ring protein n=2 Tax=Ralstonia solanacearum species complex TaxID=3116862 RepID=A0AAD0SBL7_RALSL|nr:MULTISPECIES: flagellar basal body L-ring protein FlgH [Ralstonia solanacearum species complex]BEU73922.1 flagellar basal body L-ring protein FlgH [Ralstonia pseudosolanacearum]AMP39453.1 flagellar basal body L-ring protein [Ralstonia solanacearum]AXV78839.1 flagellar basal body L-ring protein [Ralstonia solanacearum]AXV83499.1 flagellar basal body L-ring protein [Ralstonia solanacearum]AXV88288.1 flagellar basal body L-ring protein [Ralstonia solanacearum]